MYVFTRQEPQDDVMCLPAAVANEFFVVLALMPLIAAHISQPFLPKLLACDASPEFGFGVCARYCSRELVELLGTMSEKRGHYVTLIPDPGVPEKDRLGNPHHLPLRMSDLKPVISARARFAAHSGVLEGWGCSDTKAFSPACCDIG